MAKPQKGKGFAANGHKRFSASNSKRWIGCPGCIAVIESLPPAEQIGSDSIHSRRGTCAHAVGEMSLVAYYKDPLTSTGPADYLGMEVEKVLVDQEIVNGAQEYVDWARPIIDAADLVSIEEGLSLEEYITDVQGRLGEFLAIVGAEHGGTGDLVAGQYYGVLDVGDYKNGKGIIVEVEWNSQLLIYALAALARYNPEYDFDKVRLTIIQPNGQHHEGGIRSWEISVDEVFEWAETVLLPAAQLCMEAIKAFRAGDPNFVEKYLRASDDNCTFCPARARCQAALNVAADNAVVEFTEVLGENWEEGGTELMLRMPNVALITREQEELILQHGDAIIGFVQAVQQRAHARAEAGERVDGFKLVQRTTRRRYRSGEGAIKDDLKLMGLHMADFMDNPSLKSIAQLEKVFKAKGISKEITKKFMDKHVEKPDGGTELVHESHPGKAVLPAIDVEFAHLFGDDDDPLAL